MAADLLLKKFLSSRAHMALVVDENGVLTGMLTLDDVLEEIVGEIRDEFDVMEERLTKLSEDEFLVEGRFPLYELGEFIPDMELEMANVSTIAGSRITLAFSADGGVSGSSGCNRFSGPWTLAGGALRVGPLRTTRMACEPEVMQQEAAFLAALQGATAVRREGERLELRTADGALAVTATAASR